MKPEAFDCECYTDVYVRFDQDYALYDDAYDTYMDEKRMTGMLSVMTVLRNDIRRF